MLKSCDQVLRRNILRKLHHLFSYNSLLTEGLGDIVTSMEKADGERKYTVETVKNISPRNKWIPEGADFGG